MPWVNEQMCTGCGVCVEQCPVGAIAQEGSDPARINEDACIRCGRCHDVCPQEAVRHDSERIPLEVADNLRWAGKLLGHFDRPDEQAAFMERMVRFFKKQRKVNERTLEAILPCKDRPAECLEAAIGRLTSPAPGEAAGGA